MKAIKEKSKKEIFRWDMFAVYATGHSKYIETFHKTEVEAIKYAKKLAKKLPYQKQLKECTINNGQVGENWKRHIIFKKMPVTV